MPGERDLVAHFCTNCGASIQVPAPEPGAPTRITCRYCGISFEPVAPPPPPVRERVVVIAPNLPEAARVAAAAVAARSVATIVRTIVSFALLLSLGGIGVCVTQWKAMHALGTVSGLDLKLPTLPTVSSFFWDTVFGPPIPAAVGGGHVEGFVGRVRTRGDDQLWVVAFEGSKLGQFWKVGPFGTYSQGGPSNFATVVASHVVVTDYKAAVHVYDLAAGHEQRTLKLSDRAKAMCNAPDGKPHVWIEVADKRDVMVDVEAGTVTPAARPAWCPDPWASSDDCRGWLKRGSMRPGCRGPELSPKVNGFQAVNVIEEGDLGVALGKKHPGTAVPVAVGFDPHAKSVRWEQPVVSGDQNNAAELGTTAVMDALEGGRFVTPYELTPKGWHFTAFDARSGQRLWDTELQSAIGVENPEGFSLSADRVYVMRSSSIEVYDAKTGTLVGTVGQD
jgi:PQQ-like domain